SNECVYGGFMAPEQDPSFPGMDVYRLPTDQRPLNAVIVKPNAQGRNTVDLYICPSDKTSAIPMSWGGNGPNIAEERAFTSWQYNGNSYPISLYWFNYFLTNGAATQNDIDLDDTAPPWHERLPGLGRKMLKRKQGGPASRFILYYEEALNEFMFDARPDGSSPIPRIRGWHRKFSS